MTINYGLLGGKLDPSHHIEKAMEKLCTPEEIVAIRMAKMVEQNAQKSAQNN